MTPLVDRAFWRGRRVLLTGHTGFKGAWLALWLHRLGARVTGFGHAPPTVPSLYELARVAELLEDLRGDVRDLGAVCAAVARTRPAVVIHLAAQALVGRGFAAPRETYAVNVLGTANLLEAVGDRAAIVCVTSDKCYAPRPDGGAHREGDSLGGLDPYSASKAAQEHVAAAARESAGVRVATARAGNVIGGGDWAPDRLVPDLVRASHGGAPLRVRNPAAVRPWQHVLNPLAGYLRLAERLAAAPKWATAWNFGPGPEDERSVAALVAGWPEPLAVRPARSGLGSERAVLRLDSTRARARLGWTPVWDVDAALVATAGWHRAVREGRDARRVTLAQIERYERDAAAQHVRPRPAGVALVAHRVA